MTSDGNAERGNCSSWPLGWCCSGERGEGWFPRTNCGTGSLVLFVEIGSPSCLRGSRGGNNFQVSTSPNTG